LPSSFYTLNGPNNKASLLKGGRTNQIPLTIKPYPMKSQI